MTKTSDILNKAADLIEQNGWARGGGWPGDDLTGDAPVGLCLEGGIMAATGVRVDARTPEGLYWEDALKACPAFQAVTNYLGRRPFVWNDHSDRTAEEVIAVLRATAVIEAAKEEAETTAAVVELMASAA